MYKQSQQMNIVYIVLMANFDTIVAMNLKLTQSSSDRSATLTKNSKSHPFPVWVW